MRIILPLLLLSFSMIGCGGFKANQMGSALSSQGGNPNVPPLDQPDPTYEPYPPLWEAANPATDKWSEFSYQLILSDLKEQMLPGSLDVTEYCHNYKTLSSEQRANFWVVLISAVAKFESGFNPLTRFLESTLGIDPITHLAVQSEGLLQLSYQDVQNYAFCKFDWAKDKLLSLTDPRRTILDPINNLDCGIRILAQQIHTQNKIGMSSNVYWSTLKIGGMYSKISEIKVLTNKIPFCKKT